MNWDIFVLMLSGSVRDPIFWVVGAIFGWDIERPLEKSLGIWLIAGLIWGGIRAAIYLNLGENLGVVECGAIMILCGGLMCILAISIRFARVIYQR